MHFAFKDALRESFTGTGKAIMFDAESGGSIRASLNAASANDPVANKPCVLTARLAAQTERKLCDCGFISRISFLNFCNCDDEGSSVTPTSDLKSW